MPTVQPQRSRLGAMVRRLETEMPARARRLPVAGHWLELRGHAVLVDGDLRPVPPAGMALLRALARRPGRVVARAELAGAAWTGRSPLRAALGEPKLVQTVVKRGYRLALDPAAEFGALPDEAVGAAQRRPVVRARGRSATSRIDSSAQPRAWRSIELGRGRAVSELASGSSAQRLREASTERSGGER